MSKTPYEKRMEAVRKLWNQLGAGELQCSEEEARGAGEEVEGHHEDGSTHLGS